MFRVKLIVLVLVVIGALVGLSQVLSSTASSAIAGAEVEQLKSSHEVVRLAASVVQYSVVHEAESAASFAGLRAGIACPTTEEALRVARTPGPPTVGPDGVEVPGAPSTACTRTGHDLVLEALTSWSTSRDEFRAMNESRFLSERDPGFAIPRAPDLLLVADTNGVVVARVGFDKNDWFGDARPNMVQSFPVFARMDAGVAQHDIILWREAADAAPELAQVGVAPIRLEENGHTRFVGSVLVGYKLTDALVQEAGGLLYGTEVAYYFRSGEGNDVEYAGTSASTRPAFLQGIKSAEFTAGGGTLSFAELALQRNGVVAEFAFEGDEYAAMTAALAKSADGTAVNAGFVVAASISDATAPLAAFKTAMPSLGGVLALIGIFGILIAIKSFMEPIEDISKGVQEVIAGRLDYMWEVDDKSPLSDLSHSLNVMSAKLQGKRDPDAEDTEGDADWKAMAGDPGARPAGGAKPAAIAGLGNLRGRSNDDGEDDE